MQYQPIYLSNFDEDSGYQTYFDPFLLPAKAFPKLEDAICFRGKIQRRRGSFLLGRLRRRMPLLVADPDIILTQQAVGIQTIVADILADATLALRASEQYAEIVPYTLTVHVGALTFQDITGHGVLDPVGAGVPGTINYVTGQMVLNFAAAIPATAITIHFAYYPALPVMGMGSYEEISLNFETTIIFDMKYAYKWDPTNNIFIELATPPATPWSGNNSKLFWTTQYYRSAANNNILWVTNFKDGATGNPIRYYNGATWTNIYPVITPGADPTVVQTCLCILPFKDRLLLFNTWEGTNTAFTTTNYPNRIRWCANLQDPTVVLNWQPIPGLGGYNDLYTDEHIISVAPFKDVIIVKLERSCWKIIYTGNQEQPFAFQKIDSTMGCNSSHSPVMFDNGVLSISPLGITVDDSTSVERIDQKIPDQAFGIQTSPQRAFGIRDYVNELVYWAFTNIKLNAPLTSEIFNNSVLVYNYRNESWAIFNDSYTCFGKFQVSNPTYTTDLPIPGFYPPNSIIPSAQNVIAGNQQGFVHIVQLRNNILNSASLAITSITGQGVGPIPPNGPVDFLIPNHNFSATGDYWVKIDGILGNGAPGLNPEILNYNAITNPFMYKVVSINSGIINLFSWNPVARTFNIPVQLLFGGEYLGGGRVTVIQNFNITTKVFCPNYDTDQQIANKYVDLLTLTTDSGEYSCNEYVNEATPAINDTDLVPTTALLGDNRVLTCRENAILAPTQNSQNKIWHRFSCPVVAQNFQYELKMRNDQMTSLTINNNDFILYAMTLTMAPTGRMIQ
jgi:hypothetical protein